MSEKKKEEVKGPIEPAAPVIKSAIMVVVDSEDVIGISLNPIKEATEQIADYGMAAWLLSAGLIQCIKSDVLGSVEGIVRSSMIKMAMPPMQVAPAPAPADDPAPEPPADDPDAVPPVDPPTDEGKPEDESGEVPEKTLET